MVLSQPRRELDPCHIVWATTIIQAYNIQHMEEYSQSEDVPLYRGDDRPGRTHRGYTYDDAIMALKYRRSIRVARIRSGGVEGDFYQDNYAAIGEYKHRQRRVTIT